MRVWYQRYLNAHLGLFLTWNGAGFSGPLDNFGMARSLRPLPLSLAVLGAIRSVHSSSEGKGQGLKPGSGMWGTCAIRS